MSNFEFNAYNYSTVSSQAENMGERNDCAVRSLCIATETSYVKVHALLKDLGREDRQGTYIRDIWTAVRKLGYSVEPVAVKRCTVRTITKHLSTNTTYLVFTAGHVLCVKSGKVEDWTEGRLNRVQGVFKLSANQPLLNSKYVEGEMLPNPPTPNDVVTPDAAPVQPAVPVAPRNRQSVTGLVWDLAQTMWESEGKPTDKETLLALRKEVRNILIQSHDVNHHTATTQLIRWQKSILA